MGPTGSGKSTVANAFVQGVDRFLLKKSTGQLEVMQPLISNGRQVFQIGHGSESCTEAPNFVALDQAGDLFLVDCPGFSDSNKYKELPNLTLVH